MYSVRLTNLTYGKITYEYQYRTYVRTFQKITHVNRTYARAYMGATAVAVSLRLVIHLHRSLGWPTETTAYNFLKTWETFPFQTLSLLSNSQLTLLIRRSEAGDGARDVTGTKMPDSRVWKCQELLLSSNLTLNSRLLHHTCFVYNGTAFPSIWLLN